MSWERLDYISDIKILVENKEYNLHKAYLVNIPYFKTIIKAKYYTNDTIIEDKIVKKEPFESIMNDVYNVYNNIFEYSNSLEYNITYVPNISQSIEKLVLLRYYNLTGMENLLLDKFSNEIMEQYPTYEELDRLLEIGYLLENYIISHKYYKIAVKYLFLTKEILTLQACNTTTQHGYIDDRLCLTIYRIDINEQDYSIVFDDSAKKYFTSFLHDIPHILSNYQFLSKQTWFFDAISVLHAPKK